MNPHADAQAHTHTLTKVIISSLDGNTQRLDGGAMFGNAPRTLWEEWVQPDEFNRIQLACRSLLVQTHGKNILCEVGIGAFFEPKLKERFGVVEDHHVLLNSLKSFGLTHEDIDFVVLSHLHFDHAGGLLPGYVPDDVPDDGLDQNVLLFPNAHYICGKTQFLRAQTPHPRDRASYIPNLQQLLMDSNRLELIEDDQQTSKLLPPSFSFFHSHGHTPGLLLTRVQGNASSVVFLSDLIPGAAWCHIPLTMGYDRFAELVIEEKQRLYQWLEHQPWIGFFTHDPAVSAAKIEKSPQGKYQATEKYSRISKLEI